MKSIFILLVLPILLHGLWENDEFTVGNEKLISNQVNDVFLFDTRQDFDAGSWRNSPENSWFNEPSTPNDDFWGNSIDVSRWNMWDTGNHITMNNLLHFYRGNTADEYYESNLTSTWELSGNFDVTIDFNLIQWNAAEFRHESSIRLEFWVDDSNFCKLWRYRHTDDNYWGEFWINGYHYPGRETTGIGDEYQGKLRLTRNGNLLEMWRFRTSDKSWQRVYHRTDFSDAVGQIRIAFTNYDTEMEASVDNFIIHSGENTFPSVGSANRGSQLAFPEQAILVRTAASLDIFDADSKDLWMRFTGISNNDGAIGGSSTCVYALNGRVYTTWNDEYPGLVVIDFINDKIQYLSDSYNQIYEYEIFGRNYLGDWINNTPLYFIATNEVNQIYGINSGENEIIGLASIDGVRIIENQTTVYQSSYSNPIFNLLFDESENLYFSSSTFLTTSGINYLTDNFSHFNTFYISDVFDLANNNSFLFAANSNGVSKFDKNPLLYTGVNYTNTNGLAPTSSDYCIGVYSYHDTLFVASSDVANGKISAIDTTTDEFLFCIDNDELISPISNCFAAGITADYERNLLWASSFGFNYLYGSISIVRGVQIEVESGQVNLSWSQVIPASVYHIYRDTIPNFEISPATYVDSCSETNYTDTIVARQNVKYFYRISWE